METGTILLLIGIALLVIGYVWYVSIVTKRNKVQESLSGIDVQLQKRSDLIPNVLTIAKKFMQHERELMEQITALRTQVDTSYDRKDGQSVQEHLGLAEQLRQKLGSLMVQVENYPDLKSDKTMLQAQQTYNEVEAQITAARRFYNASVTQLNNAVQIFPGTLIARIAGVNVFPFYDIDEAAAKPVNAQDILK
ncbi:MAG: LemA family protein [Rickettsiales bacterium]|nr:LemA family protein [Rickettsiales bacterium]